MKQGERVRRPPVDPLPIADENSEKLLKKRTDIEDGLSRLDILMQEAQVAIARVLEIAHLVEDGVKAGGSRLQDQLDY